MKWNSIKDKKPKGPAIIVAIMEGRLECAGDPIEDAEIVILRTWHNNNDWRTMDATQMFYLPSDNETWDQTIKYWVYWQDFDFPKDMIIDKDFE